MSDVHLYHGDCLEIMPTLPAKSVQMVFADLPYAMTKISWDIAINHAQLWAMLNNLCIDTAAKIFTASPKFAATLICSNNKEFKYDMIWEKPSATGFLNARKMPLRAHEQILVFYKKQPCYNPQMTTSNKVSNKQGFARNQETSSKTNVYARLVNKGSAATFLRYPRSIKTFNHVNHTSRTHPTQKPVALLEYLIKTYTNEGDTVLDPTAGSGATAIAAMRTGRNAVCIEKDRGYYDIMCKRVADEQAQLRLAI